MLCVKALPFHSSKGSSDVGQLALVPRATSMPAKSRGGAVAHCLHTLKIMGCLGKSWLKEAGDFLAAAYSQRGQMKEEGLRYL